MSSAFPLIYIGDLAKALDPELLDPKKGQGDPAAMVQAGLRRIATMQLPGGGFSLWPGGREVHPWGSLYAAHFLVEARRAGHPVDDSLHRDALDWVASEVKAKADVRQRGAAADGPTGSTCWPGPAGRTWARWTSSARSTPATCRPESRALLAAAYASAGNPRATAGPWPPASGRCEQIERQTGGNFNSTIRNRALLLLALLDAAPKSPRIPQLVDRLARDARDVRVLDHPGGELHAARPRAVRPAAGGSRPTAARSSWAARRSAPSTTRRRPSSGSGRRSGPHPDERRLQGAARPSTA